MKYYNCVRDKIKGYVFGLGLCLMFFWVGIRALSIVLSIYNDNCSLNTCLILNNEWYKTAPRTWKVENQHPRQVRGTTRPKQRVRSVERVTDNFWMHSVWPFDQPEDFARSSDHQTSSVRFSSSKVPFKTLCTSSLIIINTNNSHEYFTTINHT